MKAGVVLALAAIVLTAPLVGLGAGYADGYASGQEAGAEDCSETDHFLRGVVGGVFYVGYSVVDPPNSPPRWRLSAIGENLSDYEEGYIAGYEKAWQSCRLRNAVVGAASWLFFYFILVAL